MNKIIIIKNFINNALSIENGEIIKNEIDKLLIDTNKETDFVTVTLDFSDICLFATPFFNACIGYFVIKLSPDEFNKKIKLINLSTLGQETYNFSYENAVIVYNNKLSQEEQEKIDNIIENNIQNS